MAAPAVRIPSLVHSDNPRFLQSGRVFATLLPCFHTAYFLS